MSNETVFFIFGIGLAISAVLVSLAGLRLKDFPGRAMPVVVLWFVILAGGAATFAVLHAKDEDKEKAAKFEEAGKEIEKEQSSGPYEQGEAEEGEEGETEEPAAEEGGELGSAVSGGEVFNETGCGSCHTFAAAASTGAIGPDLNEFLAPDDTPASIEEMIVDPNAEIAEGYSPDVMPKNYAELLSSQEIADLVAFLYENSPAGEGK